MSFLGFLVMCQLIWVCLYNSSSAVRDMCNLACIFVHGYKQVKIQYAY